MNSNAAAPSESQNIGNGLSQGHVFLSEPAAKCSKPAETDGGYACRRFVPAGHCSVRPGRDSAPSPLKRSRRQCWCNNPAANDAGLMVNGIFISSRCFCVSASGPCRARPDGPVGKVRPWLSLCRSPCNPASGGLRSIRTWQSGQSSAKWGRKYACSALSYL